MAVVVSIVPYKFLPPKIGGQKGIAFFNQYFSRHVQLICLTIKTNDNQYAQGYETIPVLSASRLRYLNLFIVFKLKTLIQKRKATHILIEHPYLGWLGILLKKLTNTKLIVHSHNIEGLRFRTIGKWWWKLLWRYERFTHRHADYNFFIHEEDRQYAIKNFGLDSAKCIVITYGIEINSIPSDKEVQEAKDYVRKRHNIQSTEKIVLFAGSFNYKPNCDAFEYIDKTLAPLLQKKDFPCKFLVCGPWLDTNLLTHSDVIITGFVEDISVYFKAADVFVNPTFDGGGIKTKLVEALGYNTNAVSTINGATGIDSNLCNGKLFIEKDSNDEAFANDIIAASNLHAEIPPQYYHHFYWGYSTKMAAEFIEQIP